MPCPEQKGTPCQVSHELSRNTGALLCEIAARLVQSRAPPDPARRSPPCERSRSNGHIPKRETWDFAGILRARRELVRNHTRARPWETPGSKRLTLRVSGKRRRRPVPADGGLQSWRKCVGGSVVSWIGGQQSCFFRGGSVGAMALSFPSATFAFLGGAVLCNVLSRAVLLSGSASSAFGKEFQEKVGTASDPSAGGQPRLTSEQADKQTLFSYPFAPKRTGANRCAKQVARCWGAICNLETQKAPSRGPRRVCGI